MRYGSAFGVLLICMIFICSAVHAEEQGNQEQENKDASQQLLNRIEELEKQLRRMEEETKARKSLEVTKEEKRQQEKEVLEAVSREYTLDPKGTLNVDYSLTYAFSPSEDIISQQQQLTLRRTADHTLTHGISASYSVLDNLTTSTTLPIVYRYNKQGTDEEIDETDIGDISLGLAWQPIRSAAGDIRSTVSFGVVLPTGRSPYKINPNTELSTGNGQYSFSTGASFSKQVDPVVVFWRLGYNYPLDVTGLNYLVQNTYTLEKVKPGSSVEFSAGMGYALSYATSINISFNYNYEFSTELFYKDAKDPIKTGDDVSASVGIGIGWKVSPKTTVSFSLGHSLTNSSFSVSFRVPFTFVL